MAAECLRFRTATTCANLPLKAVGPPRHLGNVLEITSDLDHQKAASGSRQRVNQMRRSFTRIIAGAALFLFGVFAAIMLLSDTIANHILAHAIRPEDQELPITAYPLRTSSDSIQIVGGQGEGLDCSLPWGVNTLAFRRGAEQASISLQMRQACVFHDYCYRHGNATYGYTQADCDFILQEHAFRLCTQIKKQEEIPDCETDARKVVLGVRAGRAGSFRRADNVTGRGNRSPSTFFELDPYPTQSSEYTVVRIADTPIKWKNKGTSRKSLCVFTIHQSGTRVYIIGLKSNGLQICSTFDLPSEYRYLTVPPVVLRHAASGADWLVWIRRGSLDNTGVTFDGVSPEQATLGDWRAVFGRVTYPKEGSCRESPFGSDAEDSAGRQQAYFAGVRIANEESKRSDDVRFDPLISEFHAPTFPRDSNLNDKYLHLFGLTTYPCAAKFDASTCVGHIRIDPQADTGIFKLFRTLDPDCIAEDHESSAAAKPLKTSRTCDRYRDFAAYPMVISQDGVPGIAWIRRGAGNGSRYSQSAILR